MNSFLTSSSNIKRDGFIWNMFGRSLMAFQLVIFLMVLTRTVGLERAGIFSIAYANAGLFLNIGKYGMRNYQISDVKNEYIFCDYLLSRWITMAVMIVISVIYVLYTARVNQYSMEKILIIMATCLFKAPDCIEDIYYGDYQKKGRLDVAAKMMTVRMVMTIIFFITMVSLTKDLLQTIIFSTFFTIILMTILIKWTKSDFMEKKSLGVKRVGKLLITCFPVFLGAFLAYYISNAPKYAIDAQLTDEVQACYGFIAMPAFVIGLLDGFIFHPVLHRISCLWNEKERKTFIKQVVKQIGFVCGITFSCLMAAFFLGIPVLSWLYDTDLSAYKAELLILILGGGFLCLSSVLSAVITIMRRQNSLMLGYGIVALAAFFLSNDIVRKYEMMGAAILYAGLVLVLCVCFFMIIFIGLKKNRD